MNKCLLSFLFILCLPAIAVGNDNIVVFENPSAQEFREDNTTKIDIKDPVLIATLYKKFGQDFPEEVDNILNNKNMTDSERLARYTRLYANKVFNDVKEEEIAKLKARSKATGRKIVQKGSIKDGMVQRLYMGDYLESEACDNKKNKFDFKAYVEEAKHTCLYPDGYEEHEIIVTENGGYKALWVIEDDKSKGTTRMVDIRFNGDMKKDYFANFFNYGSDVVLYDEFAKYRNVNAKNMQSGYMITNGYCQNNPKDKRCKDYKDKEYEQLPPVNKSAVLDWAHDDRHSIIIKQK